MKKFLSTAVALGMVAGLAATASALELKVKGKYVADGYYFNSGNGAAGDNGLFPWDMENTFRGTMLDGMEPGNDDWYEHTFRIDPTLIINDKVQVKGDIRLIDSNSVWGKQEDLQRFDGGGVRVNKIWLIYDSPVGKWEVGRRPAGAWMGDFVNSGTAADRIMWWAPKMDNFKAYAFLQKTEEQDGYWRGYVDIDGTTHPMDNQDNDYYEVAGGYVTEGVNAWLGLGWKADKTNDIGVLGSDTNMYRFKGYGDMAINEQFSLATEFDYKWGQTEYNAPGVSDMDISAFAFIASAMGNFGDLSASLHYAYISGDNDTTDDENNAYDVANGTGADFEPLYILTGSAANVLNGDRGANLVGTTVRQSGVHAIVALADFKTTEDLTLHGGIGWGQADDAPSGWDDAYGWEVDLGLAYKLYENLTYELHFGWWLVGDFAELGISDIETNDILMLSHHLSMKF